MKKRIIGFTCLAAGLIAVSAAGGQNDDLAVIVNKQTPVLGTTSNELKEILLGGREKWPNGTKVTPVILSLEHPETQAWLKEICRMTEQDYKKYFMQMSFQGRTVNVPRLFASAAQVKAAVAGTPGAIGILPMHDVDGSVNTVNVDGVAPGGPGYKLSAK